MQGLGEELAKSSGFDQVFEVVKKAVQRTMGLHRAGLTLALAEIPNFVGAYHILGSNFIVVNRVVLSAVEALAKSKGEVNAFLFSILAHEYLHSLGFTDEGEVRRLVHRVSRECFGEGHPATEMASGGIERFYPQLRHLGPGRMAEGFEIIKDFDKSSMPYIA